MFNSLGKITCLGLAAVLGAAVAADAAVLKWSDLTITTPGPTTEDQAYDGGKGLGSGRTTAAMPDIVGADVGGSGVDVTIKTTLHADSMYISSSPNYRTDQIEAGGYGVLVETHLAARADTPLKKAGATVEITFSQPVEDVSFIYAGLRSKGSRYQQVTFYADGSDEGFSLTLNDPTSLERVGTNAVKGVADISSGTDAKGVVMVSLTGPVTTLTYVIENIPVSGFGGMGASIGDIAFTPVPEPAALSVLGLGGLALIRRRRA